MCMIEPEKAQIAVNHWSSQQFRRKFNQSLDHFHTIFFEQLNGTGRGQSATALLVVRNFNAAIRSE